MYCWPNIIRVVQLRRMRWAEHVAYTRDENKYNFLVARPKGKITLGKHRYR